MTPTSPRSPAAARPAGRPLYTPQERARRDASRWTLVQGVLAPLQFGVFLVSLALVLRSLDSGAHESAALISVGVKTAVLYLIMITGSIWEKQVFGPDTVWESLCPSKTRSVFWEPEGFLPDDRVPAAIASRHETQAQDLVNRNREKPH